MILHKGQPFVAVCLLRRAKRGRMKIGVDELELGEVEDGLCV